MVLVMPEIVIHISLPVTNAALDELFATAWARWLRFINKLVTPSPKYYPKGSATKYRRLANTNVQNRKSRVK
jgi:hypothetical protein